MRILLAALFAAQLAVAPYAGHPAPAQPGVITAVDCTMLIRLGQFDLLHCAATVRTGSRTVVVPLAQHSASRFYRGQRVTITHDRLGLVHIR